MIGNVIQSQFLTIRDYPTAAALSFVLMAAILAGDLRLRAAARRPDPDGAGRMRTRGPRARPGCSGGWSALALLYLFTPIFIVVLFSFNDNKGRFNFTWQGFTLRHWQHPLADPDLALAMKNSLIVAGITVVIAVVLGVFMAIALVRYGFRGRGATDFFIFLPLATPEVVLGAALLALFLTMNVNTGFSTIVIAHVMFCLSYVVVTVKARLEGMDRYIEEAAMDLGATEWTTFRKITIPMIAPGIAAAALLCRRALVRRLRHHVVQQRHDADVPALHLRRHPAGRARRGQRARHDAARRRPRADVRRRRRAAPRRTSRGAGVGGPGVDPGRRPRRSLTVRHTARGWWLEEAGPVDPRPPLSGDETADVVVVGGGFAGMWTAWHVLERAPDARVAILEADVCGHGPSGRNGGFADSLRFAAPRLRAMAGDDGARATIGASLESVRRIGEWARAQDVDCWYHASPQLMVSTAPAQDGAWARAVAAHAALGDPAGCRELTGAEVRARCDTPAFRGGVLVAGSATVHPARLALGLRARLLGRGGVAIHEGTRVRALRAHGDAVLAETAGGRVRARAAVLAIGARIVGVPGRRNALTFTSSHVVLTEPVPDVIADLGWTGGEPITDARTLLHYFRPTRDGRILFGWGGGRIALGARGGTRAEIDPEVVAQARADLVRIFPSLAGRRIAHAWGGPIDASPTHLPAIRALPGGRAWTVAGFTGNGVGPSHLCGRILARLALDERDDLTRLALVDPPRASVPPEPLRWIGGSVIRGALDRKERAEEAGGAACGLDRAVAAVPGLMGVHIGR